MDRRFTLAAPALLAFAVPAIAQGDLETLPKGEYVCALPGDAAGAAWIEQPALGFKITGASSYNTNGTGGTYLMEGKRLQFTRGPLKGKRFLRLNSGLLQEIDASNHLGRLRCHRSGRAELNSALTGERG